MRVVGGSARGRRLISPEGMDIRPTTDKVKESVFNIIQFETQGSDVLDLFAGSGQIGIEALSRGARSAVFTDSSKKSLDIVKKNLSAVGFLDRAKVVQTDSLSFLQRCTEKFGIVYLDPPYHKGLIIETFRYLPAVLTDESVVICETKADEKLPDVFSDFCSSRVYRYSSVLISVYRHGKYFEEGR